MELDLIRILKLNLNINEWLTLFKIDSQHNNLEFPFTSTVKHIQSLMEKGYVITDSHGTLYLTELGREAIEPPKERVDFDEIFNLYPFKTPNGRMLHTKNKEIAGKETKEYKYLKNKYLLRVHTESLHNQVVNATKMMLKDKAATNSLDYLQQLETYINQQGWERYMDENGEAVEVRNKYNSTERI